MPNAVTHVLLAIILVDLFRDRITHHKRYFTLHTLLIAGFAGLLPDVDVVIRMYYEFQGSIAPSLLYHGGIFHTPLFALIFIIPGAFLWMKEKHKSAAVFFVICFGILLHIFLDYLIGGGAHEGVMWLWPLSTETWKIHLLGKLSLSAVPQAIDAIILLAWLFHQELKHKISDFI